MAQEACLLIEDDGVEVDLSAPAMSAAAYLKQMRAERKATAEVMTRRNEKVDSIDSTSPEAKKQKMARMQWLEKNGVRVVDSKKDTNEVGGRFEKIQNSPVFQTPTSLIPSEAWQLAKCQEFGKNREKMAERIANIKPMKIKALNQVWFENNFFKWKLHDFSARRRAMARDSTWKMSARIHRTRLAIPKSHRDSAGYADGSGDSEKACKSAKLRFLTFGKCAPLRIVWTSPFLQLSQLIEYLVEWSVDEGLNRPIREWIYALLLVIDLPLVQDVISALRTLAKQCK